MKPVSVHLAAPAGDALARSLAAVRTELGLDEPFAPEVLAEADAAIAGVRLPERDLLELPFATIDPEGSTDLDQAFHLARRGDGYLVHYAIADVPLFVSPGGAIDAEARSRGQTMYAPDGRRPLHPLSLSEDVASLLPDRERSAFVWRFELDERADVTAVTVERARVRSRRRWSYAEVQAEIDGGSPHETLELLPVIGDGRIALERERGGASLTRPEQEVELVDGRYLLRRRSQLAAEGWNAQLSLMTGMAAARMMLDGGVGILRTMPAPDPATIERFRLQVEALGVPWASSSTYGDYLRALDQTDAPTPAIVQAAAALFRGAGYSAFDGEAPAGVVQAAVGAPYAHVTAPLRRLVDRFGLVACEALSAGLAVPPWVREALPSLPEAMAASDAVASKLDRGVIDRVEAAVLAPRVGETFAATVVSAGNGRGVIQLADPAVSAKCDGALVPGVEISARLVSADIHSGEVRFEVVA